MSRIPTLWLRGGPAPRGRQGPLGPEPAPRVPLAGSTLRQPQASPTWSVQHRLLASSAGRVAGAWAPVSPPRRRTPGAGRPVAAGQDAQPPPGAREALGRRGGARDTERVESGARELRRRISWARLPGATMAFGKSHRDPYATSVGHLIGKEVRGKTPAEALGVGVPFRFDSFHGQRRTLLVKFEAILPLPPATFPGHPHSKPSPFEAFLYGRLLLLTPSSKYASLLMPPGEWNRAGEPQHGIQVCSVGASTRRGRKLLGQGKVISKVRSLESIVLFCPFYRRGKEGSRRLSDVTSQ